MITKLLISDSISLYQVEMSPFDGYSLELNHIFGLIFIHCMLVFIHVGRLIKHCESSQKKKQNLYIMLLSDLNTLMINYQQFVMKLHLLEVISRWPSENPVLTSCCSEASEVSLVLSDSGLAIWWGFFFHLAQSYQHNRGPPPHILPSGSHVLKSCCYPALPQLIWVHREETIATELTATT